MKFDGFKKTYKLLFLPVRTYAFLKIKNGFRVNQNLL